MLRVGSARMNITPYIGCPMAGYMARSGPSVGVHDDLWAKIMVIEKWGDEPIAIISADLVGIPSDIVRQIKKIASEELAIPASRVLIGATHTHSGPAIMLGSGSNTSLDPDAGEQDFTTLISFST